MSGGQLRRASGRLVLNYTNEDLPSLKLSGIPQLCDAEVLHAVRDEMAVHLSDVVFRRTDMGTGPDTDKTGTGVCARPMADELGWDQEAIDSEIESVGKTFHTAASYPY